MPELAIADPHHHLWEISPRYPWLSRPGRLTFQGDASGMRRDYLLADFLADAAGLRLIRSVHVEAIPADPLAETRWLQEIAGAHGFPHGIVARVALEAPDAAGRLAEQAAFRNVRGVRQILNWHPDPGYRYTDRSDYLTDPAWRAGFARLARHGFSFDMQIYPAQMAQAAALGRDYPGIPIVLNHTGMPIGRDQAAFAEWQAGMRLLAAVPSVTVKISGLGMMDHHWTTDSIRPWVRETIELFGPGRCMFASNFPVDRLYSSYRRLWEAYDEVTADLPAADREQLFSATAIRTYRL